MVDTIRNWLCRYMRVRNALRRARGDPIERPMLVMSGVVGVEAIRLN